MKHLDDKVIQSKKKDKDSDREDSSSDEDEGSSSDEDKGSDKDEECKTTLGDMISNLDDSEAGNAFLNVFEAYMVFMIALYLFFVISK